MPSSVLDMITPALATKIVRHLRLGGNNFAVASDGIKFTTEFIRNNRRLEEFCWIDNPIENANQANDILKVVVSHPTLHTISLENSLGPSANAYCVLCLLVASNKNILKIDLKSSNVVANGRIDLPEILSTNPPLQTLRLSNNNLVDDDAVLIADSLKRNINLREIDLQENDFTTVGWDALDSAVFDSTCLNSMADCNHTCWIVGYGLSVSRNRRSNPNLNRGWKLGYLLSAKCHGGTISNDLHLEFGDDSATFVPMVLECVQLYSGYFDPLSQQPAKWLFIIYEILRGWKVVPELLGDRSNR